MRACPGGCYWIAEDLCSACEQQAADELMLAKGANPFMVNICGQICQTVDSTDRIHMVKQFTASECRSAIALPNLQKTVLTAIERRLRKLERAS